MNKHWLLWGFLIMMPMAFPISFIPSANAQTITVNSTTPCWQNYTAYAEMWRNCGITEDWLQTIFLPWQYATGGYVSMFIAGILIMFTYIKYHKVVYPLLIGTVMLPLSFAIFPNQFLNFAFIMGSVSLGFLIIHVMLRMSKDWD